MKRNDLSLMRPRMYFNPQVGLWPVCSWWERAKKVNQATFSECVLVCVNIHMSAWFCCHSTAAHHCQPCVLKAKKKQQVIIKHSCGRLDFTVQPAGSNEGMPHCGVPDWCSIELPLETRRPTRGPRKKSKLWSPRMPCFHWSHSSWENEM